ncbi:I78 family peptidase inhibitor [Arenimonas alkanexedens]
MNLLRSLFFATAGLALMACATPAPEAMANPPETRPLPATSEELPMSCDAKKGQWAVGKIADDVLVAKVKADTGSTSYRVIPPDTAVTMDYREDRVNIDVDAANLVTAVRCG